MRWMYLAYGVPPYAANGDHIVYNYSGGIMVPVLGNNGGTPPGLPSPGDVLQFSYNHTAVVYNVDANYVYTLQQNVNNTDGLGQLAITNGSIPGYSVSGWLHHPGGLPNGFGSASGAIYSPSVALNSNGTLETAVVNASGLIEHAWQACPVGCGWAGPYDMAQNGLAPQGRPFMAQNQDGSLVAFVRHKDNTIWHCDQSNGWNCSWSGTGSNVQGGDPTASLNPLGGIELFQVLYDGRIRHDWQTQNKGSWSGWHDITATNGLSAQGSPVSALDGSGNLRVFTFHSDNTVWQCDRNSGWVCSPYMTGGTAGVGLGVAKNADGRLELFLNANGTLLHNWQTSNGGAFSGWYGVNGNGLTAVGTPVAQVDSNGHMQVFIRHVDNTVWYCDQGNNWNCTWSMTGGTPTAGEAAIGRNQDGRLEILMVDTNHVLQHDWQKNAGSPFSGWQPLGAL
jgi:hypothetical protein